MWLIIAIIIVLIILIVWFNPIPQIATYVSPYQIMAKDLVYGKNKIVLQSGGWNAPAVPIIMKIGTNDYSAPTCRGLQIVDADQNGKIIKKTIYDMYGDVNAAKSALAHLKTNAVYRLVAVFDEASNMRKTDPISYAELDKILPDFNKVGFRYSYVALFKYGQNIGHSYGVNNAKLDIEA